MFRAKGRRPQLLYITSTDPSAGSEILRLESRVTIGVLSRDFDVSLGVIGDVNTLALKRLRTELGPMRVAGGFEGSSADRPTEGRLRRHAQERLGSEIVNARLQTVIQRKARQVNAVLIDSLEAWPYRPVVRCPLAYIAREIVSADTESNFLDQLFSRGLRDYEMEVMNAADPVFATPDMARALMELGVPLRKLEKSLTEIERKRPTLAEVDFSRTKPKVGYAGYLGNTENVASLVWFLDNVWPVLVASHEEVEFLVVGEAPPEDLVERIAQTERCKLIFGNDDHDLISEHCRVVIEPLRSEQHVDAKLVNAMARGIPTVTTRHAANRAHVRLLPGLIASDSREAMAVSIRRLLTDSQVWKRTARQSTATGRDHLRAFELAHTVRRGLDVPATDQAAAKS